MARNPEKDSESSAEQKELTKEGIINEAYSKRGMIETLKARFMVGTGGNFPFGTNELERLPPEVQEVARAIDAADNDIYESIKRQEDQLRALGKEDDADEVHRLLFGEIEDEREQEDILSTARRLSEEAKEK